MSDTLFDLSQYKSEATQKYSPDWRDATGTDPAWDKPDLEPNLEARTGGLEGDASTEWRTPSEFTITLESGQTVEVRFVPGLEGELSMHQFDFTGPISPTGFKSHFVLAVESEDFLHPRDYAHAYAQEVVAKREKKHKVKNTKRPRSVAGAQAPQKRTADDNNSTLEPAMAENNTPDHPAVEVVEELSPSESADRQRLELKVERAFYEGGAALRELRDRRLYRNTHRTFEQYCQDRFSFSRFSAYNKIIAAEVMDNLLSIALQISEHTNEQPLLPNSERQCKELAKLPKEQQPQAWLEAIARTPGLRVPAASTVKAVVLEMKGIVDRSKQKNPSSPDFALGDVCEIRALKRSPLHPFHGMWGIIEHVGSFSYTVRISIAKDTQQCKGEEMTLIEDEYTADIKAVGKRIQRLVELDLDPVDFWVLEGLQRSRSFTPRQLLYLERIESDYGLKGR